MKQASTLFLKSTIVAIGLVVLAICIFALPIGLRDDASGLYRPIILAMYVAALPFFAAIYQALKLLGFIEMNKAFSDLSVNALNYIKYCAITISALFAIASPYIYIVADRDDAPGVLALALIILFTSGEIATFAALLQKLLQNAIELKSENELTV